ncbi:hypothetical protein ABI59_05575 [Acidobacteria bacterium Mor1]|nr:hypothetical protein ABI59_05575 [Acidobacteria bacterium Mor1]
MPPIVRRIIWILVAVSAVSVLVEVLPYHKHGHYPIETSFGFHAWYGFVCCFMLVVVAAQMRKVLMRPEDYYDDEDSEPGPGNGEDS